MTSYLPTRLGVFSFAYTWLVFGITYGMKAAQSGVKPYYISGLLNSAEDTVFEFVIRWLLWGSIPVLLFGRVRRRLSVRWAWAILLAWMLAIVTGVDPRVFGGPAPPEVLAISHYVASGLVLLVASLILLQIQRYLGWFWIFVTVVYCSTFLVSRFSDAVDIPSEIYITTEYLLYFITGVAVLLVPAPEPTPLEEVKIVPPVTIRSREREMERMHR